MSEQIDERTQMLSAAWLPPRACKEDSRCRLSAFENDTSLDPQLRAGITYPSELMNYFSGHTSVLLPHGGETYNLSYSIVRALVLLGHGAKIVHMLDLEDPPEMRAGVDFMSGLVQCKFLVILGFYESTEDKPKATRKVSHLLQRLECDKMLVTDEVLDGQTWWSQEFVSSLGDLTYINSI